MLLIALIIGNDPIPRSLLVMGVLKMLGSSSHFSDLTFGSLVSKTAHQSFFHAFLERFVATQYDRYIAQPADLAELQDICDQYAKLGFPGCVGSIDCCHIPVRTFDNSM